MAKNKFTHTPSDVFPSGVFELEVFYFRKSIARIKLTASNEVAAFARTVVYEPGSIQYCENIAAKACLYWERFLFVLSSN